MGRKRKRRLGLARRARSDLPARPFPQAKQPIPYAPPAGLDCAMAGMQKSAQGKFCGDKLRRARKNGDIAIGQKTPRERRQKNASMPPKCELPTLPLRRVQTSPAVGNATMHGTVRRLIWTSKAVTRAWQKCPPARGEYSTPRKRRPSAPFF